MTTAPQSGGTSITSIHPLHAILQACSRIQLAEDMVLQPPTANPSRLEQTQSKKRFIFYS